MIMKLINKLILLAIAAVSLNACDKNGDGGYTLPTSKPVTFNISYSYENTTDFFSLFEATITYKDVKGETKSETITKNWEYKASAPIAQDPKQYLFKINIKNKEVSELKESYTLSLTGGAIEASITATHDDNKIYPHGPSASIKRNSGTINKDKLEEYRSGIPAKGKDLTFISHP